MSLRSACDMRRAWRPTWVSPISPSISARGVSAATESITTTSIAPERMSMSEISSACSPVSGWEMSSSSMSTPMARGVDRVHGVLGVDVGADAAVALGLGHHVHGEGRLARGLGAVDLDDPAPGQAADAEGEVERQRAGGDGLDGHGGLLAHLHDRALAELLLDLAEGHVEVLLTVHRAVLSCGGVRNWRVSTDGRTRLRSRRSGGPDRRCRP